MATDTASTNFNSATSPSSNSSPSPAPSRTGSPNSTLFSPGASPPLILAFLAIGLFTISMVAVFGWRRVQLGRIGPHYFEQTDFGERRRQGFGEKPKLWDLWTEGTTTGNERDVGWDGIMPVAVMVVPDDQGNTHTPQPTLNSPVNTPVRHILWARRPLRTPSPDSNVKAEPTPPAYSHLQVAVAIAMPSPQPNDIHTNHQQEITDDTSVQLDYTIGLYHYGGHRKGPDH